MRHLLIAELIFNHSQLVAGIDTKLNAVVLISVKVKNRVSVKYYRDSPRRVNPADNT